MKKIIQNLLFLLFISLSTYAQDEKSDLEKKLERIDNLLEQGKIEDAEKIAWKLVEKNKTNGASWDKLSKVHLYKYLASKKDDKLFQNISITTKDKDGNEIKDDTSASKLLDFFGNYKPSDLVKNRFLLTCREACINSDDAEMSSIYLRIYKVDPLVDTLVKKSAKKAFDKAEIEFGNHNYKGAMEYYSDALEIQPDYYKARLYLGDALYSTKNYMGAIKNYRLAHLFHPDLAEPVKYLVDAYFHEKLYDSAFYYAKIGMMIYPDYSMVQKFESASARVGDRIKLHWLNRDVLPNTNEKGLISTPTDFEKKYIEAEGKDWKNYQAAQIEILQYCNEKGIIKTDNPITKQKYAEVYAWDKMLEKTTDTKFDFAKKMKEKGYLDCYVLMSCFHYDFYRQYKSFVKKNEDKLMKYFEILKSN